MMALFVTLPDEPIPAGTAAGQQPGTDLGRGNVYRAVEAMMATQVTVAVEGRAVAVGHGELHVGFVPLVIVKRARHPGRWMSRSARQYGGRCAPPTSRRRCKCAATWPSHGRWSA